MKTLGAARSGLRHPTPETLRVEQLLECRSQLGRTLRIDEESATPGDFWKARHARSDRRNARGHRLRQRQSESFIERRIDEHSRARGERRKILFGDVAKIANAGCARLKPTEHGGIAPTSGPGEDEIVLLAQVG